MTDKNRIVITPTFTSHVEPCEDGTFRIITKMSPIADQLEAHAFALTRAVHAGGSIYLVIDLPDEGGE